MNWRSYKPTKNKYNAHRTNDGASDKEVRRKRELELLQRAGKIQNLECQVRFVLIPEHREPDTVGPRGGIRKGKVIEHSCEYVADFVYTENGETVVEDVKGYRDGEAYRIYVIKRKLMLDRYGIRIRET